MQGTARRYSDDPIPHLLQLQVTDDGWRATTDPDPYYSNPAGINIPAGLSKKKDTKIFPSECIRSFIQNQKIVVLLVYKKKSLGPTHHEDATVAAA
jgi:hypothetical protein